MNTTSQPEIWTPTTSVYILRRMYLLTVEVSAPFLLPMNILSSIKTTFPLEVIFSIKIIRSRAKSTPSLNCIFYMRELSFSKNYRSSKTIYLRTVPNFPNVHHANHPRSGNHRPDPQVSVNGESPISKKDASTSFRKLRKTHRTCLIS